MLTSILSAADVESSPGPTLCHHLNYETPLFSRVSTIKSLENANPTMQVPLLVITNMQAPLVNKYVCRSLCRSLALVDCLVARFLEAGTY